MTEHIYCLNIVRQISIFQDMTEYFGPTNSTAQLAQSVEHETLNLSQLIFVLSKCEKCSGFRFLSAILGHFWRQNLATSLHLVTGEVGEYHPHPLHPVKKG